MIRELFILPNPVRLTVPYFHGMNHKANDMKSLQKFQFNSTHRNSSK